MLKTAYKAILASNKKTGRKQFLELSKEECVEFGLLKYRKKVTAAVLQAQEEHVGRRPQMEPPGLQDTGDAARRCAALL